MRIKGWYFVLCRYKQKWYFFKPFCCSAAFKDWNSWNCCWRTRMQTTTLIIYVNKSTPLEVESSGVYAFCWFPPPPCCLSFIRLDPSEASSPGLNIKPHNHSHLHLQAGRTPQDWLSPLFPGRGRKMKHLHHTVKNVENRQTPNNKKTKGIISAAEQQHLDAPAYFSVVQSINKQNAAVLFIEDWCICIYTQKVEMWKLEVRFGVQLQHIHTGFVSGSDVFTSVQPLSRTWLW